MEHSDSGIPNATGTRSQSWTARACKSINWSAPSKTACAASAAPTLVVRVTSDIGSS
jgi:hypothetical protein